MNDVKISVVSPVFMAENIIDELVVKIIENLNKITSNYEIILVDDGSIDKSWEKIKNICNTDEHVKGVRFSRNFGQHHAISAGLSFSNGEWVVVMDCDLQDNPEDIIPLYNQAITGWDIVLGRRVRRNDCFLKKLSSTLFYKTLNFLTDTESDQSIGTYRILNKKVVQYFNMLKEQSRFFGGLINWLGFKVCTIDLNHKPRKRGTKSTYTYKKLINLAIDSILSFSDKPIKICIKIGFLMLLLSTIFILTKIFSSILNGTSILGWASIITSIFFSTGLIVINLGLIGLYIGQIFKEVKDRPLFVIQESVNLK